MAATQLHSSSAHGNGRQGLRIPMLPGKTPMAAKVDGTCESYKAGFRDASIECAQEKAALQRAHEAFVASIGATLNETEARYREESLALVRRLFAAVAPSLAREASLNEISALLRERTAHSGDELSLRAHPDLIAHLPDTEQKTLSENPKIVLMSDPSCSPSAIDARWSKGGLAHDPDALIEEILNVLGADAQPQKGLDDEQ